MGMPELTPVTSSRFKAWHYDQKSCELYVQFPPSKKQPHGVTCIYSSVAPEVYDEGTEADSKGSWLYQEIISKPIVHPFRVIPGTPPEGESRQEFENDRMGQTGEDNAAKLGPVPVPKPESKPEPDPLVPEPIRAIAALPQAPLMVMPEILPPDVSHGEKPFNQVVRERALAIAAAVPFSLRVTSADSYKALGGALVVIQTERRAVDKALEIIARPMIEMKRGYDAWRNEVLTKYDEAEKRLSGALQNFKRMEDNRVREEEFRQRRENEARARRIAEEAAEVRRKEIAEEARQMAEAAQQRLNEAHSVLTAAQESRATESTSDPLFGATGASIAASVIADATEDIRRANIDIQEAATIAATPVEVGTIYVQPAVVAKTDLKVAGLRRKAALWRWRLKQGIANKPIKDGQPISRLDLRNPDSFGPELWILDQAAVSAMVRSMAGRTSIEAIETFDENA